MRSCQVHPVLGAAVADGLDDPVTFVALTDDDQFGVGHPLAHLRHDADQAWEVLDRDESPDRDHERRAASGCHQG